jgi:3-hydroxyacyl-CoA dehydrogenase
MPSAFCRILAVICFSSYVARRMSELSATVSIERRDGVALLWCDNPPVNAISQSIRSGLFSGISQISNDEAIKAVIIICRGRSFFAGADITEFGLETAHPDWSAVDRAIDLSPKPIIAAIHGKCLGGGFEYALACQYRIADRRSQFAFPEVKLGLIPGGGGTQRFPRLAGVDAALDIIPTGRTIDADEALKLGVIDIVAHGSLENAALSFAAALLATQQTPIRARERNDRILEANGNTVMFAKAREAMRKRYRGYAAPLRSIDSIENAIRLPFDLAMKTEAEIFRECQGSAEHRALAHLFFAERTARRVPGLSPDQRARDINAVAVIGGGTMGRGIALVFAEAGLPVRLIEASDSAALDAHNRICGELEQRVSKGRLIEGDAAGRLDRIRCAGDLSAAVGADLVIEAVYEDMELKRQVFTDLDRMMAPGSILATNTSNLDVNEIASATRRPRDVIGLHFFSPAPVMKLLEIVRGDRTADDVIATALAIASRTNKQPVVAGVCDGFIVNRAFREYWRQSRFLVEEGASPYEIDKALVNFGMPQGPFAVSDLVGLDVSVLIRRNRRLAQPAAGRADRLEDELVEAGRLGVKNGRGWYRYDPGARRGSPDPDVLELIESHRRRAGKPARAISADEIIERCIYGVINEGASEIEEGVAIRASDIDVAAVHGYGFPAFRGGPMHYADEIGLRHVAATIEKQHARQGETWRPSRLLLDLARSGGRFSDR